MQQWLLNNISHCFNCLLFLLFWLVFWLLSLFDTQKQICFVYFTLLHCLYICYNEQKTKIDHLAFKTHLVFWSIFSWYNNKVLWKFTTQNASAFARRFWQFLFLSVSCVSKLQKCSSDCVIWYHLILHYLHWQWKTKFCSTMALLCDL